MGVKIRAAIPGDERDLSVLNSIVQDLHVVNRPDYFKPSTEGEVVKWFNRLLQDTSSRIWIADEGGAAVGYVLIFFHERPENPFCRSLRWCEIDQIAVKPDFRRRGITGRLIEKAIMSAAGDGIFDVELSTWSFNETAQAAFRKLGFVPKIIRMERKPDLRK